MSWSDRRVFLALAGAALTGCGFQPALRAGGAAGSPRGRTKLVLPQGRLGFALREVLIERLGQPGADADHILRADLVLGEQGLAITPDSSITRFVVRGESNWRLDGPEGSGVIEGVERAQTAYSATGSLYATRAAQRDAEERVSRELGERIATRIIARLGVQDSPGGTTG